MDKVLVSLLLVVVAVVAAVGIEAWFNGHRDGLLDKSNTVITEAMS